MKSPVRWSIRGTSCVILLLLAVAGRLLTPYSAVVAFSPHPATQRTRIPTRSRIHVSTRTTSKRITSTQLYTVPPSPAKEAAIKLASLAGETAVRWIIPAIALRILFGGFRALLGKGQDDNKRRRGGSVEDQNNEALAKIIGEGKELDNSFYNEEILEDIALGTNLGPWSPNGYIWRRYTDILANRERRPISRLFSWFLGSPGDGDMSPAGSGGASLFGRDGRRNPALPRLEYLRVERINERLESYGFSVQAAVKSRAVAASALKAKNFERAYGLAVGAGTTAVGGSDKDREALRTEEMSALIAAEAIFLKKSATTLGQIHACDRELRDLVMKRTFQNMKVEDDEDDEQEEEEGANAVAVVLAKEEEEDDDDNTDSERGSKEPEGGIDNNGEDEVDEIQVVIDTSSIQSERKGIFGRLNIDKTNYDDQDEAKAETLMMVLGKFNQELIQWELDFINSVVEILGPTRAPPMRAALLHTSGPAGRLVSSIEGRPLKVILGELGLTDLQARRKSLFVLDFPGDISASQVKMLREEVTGVIRSASEGDEALVVLKSGGGSVTGYGLAAGQLQRLKDAGLELTICVEELAASGGYMMCCVADRIVASPFAALGSVGVVLSSPNVYERLKREGIEVQTVTAGKYKRTLIPTKKITKEDLDKTKAEAEEVLELFKHYVQTNRPSLDLNEIATGEVWYGADCLEKGLCDEIATKDDVLLQYVDNNYDVYTVKFEEPRDERGGLRDLLPVGAQSSSQADGRRTGFIRRIVREIVRAAREEIASPDTDQTNQRLQDLTHRRPNIKLEG